MKVILLKSVPKVGKKDEIVEVNQGYANNALFPQKLAIPATQHALDALRKKQQNTKADKEIRRNLLDRAIHAINGEHMELSVQANEQGSLFSKIDEKDIAEFFTTQHRIAIDPKCIILPEGPLKKIGEHTIQIEDDDYKATVQIMIRKI